MKFPSSGDSQPSSTFHSDRLLIGLVVILLIVAGVISTAVVWVYAGGGPQPTASPTPAPPVIEDTAPPTSAIPTLPPEWTATPFPTRASNGTPSASTAIPGATQTTPFALPTLPASVTTQPPTGIGGQAAPTGTGSGSTAAPTSTATLATPPPLIPPGGYPGSATTGTAYPPP